MPPIYFYTENHENKKLSISKTFFLENWFEVDYVMILLSGIDFSDMKSFLRCRHNQFKLIFSSYL